MSNDSVTVLKETSGISIVQGDTNIHFHINIATIERSPEGKIEMMRVHNKITGEVEILYCDPKPLRFCSGHELEIAKQLAAAKKSAELNGINFNPRISITTLNGKVS